MTDELKPCPFCGEEVKIHINDMFQSVARNGSVTYDISCSKCFAAICILFSTKQEAIETWNRRVEK